MTPDLIRTGTGPSAPAWRGWLLRLGGLAPSLIFLAAVLAPPLNHDVAAVLDFASRMLGGERLYSDLIDVNPPLIFLLNLPAAWMARHSALTPPEALLICLLVACAAVLALVAALLRLPGRHTGPVERATLFFLMPLLLVASGHDFGQREQIMAMLAFPYLFMAERRIEGLATPRPLGLAVTLIAGLGFALKPHFLAVPALVEALVLLARLRRPGLAVALRDPVPWLMAGFWAAYLAGIVLFFPDYFGRVVPLVFDWYLDLGGTPWWRVLLTDLTGSAAILALALLGFVSAARFGWLPRLLTAAVMGGMAAALVQHKGWSYHLVPVWMWGGLAGGLLLARGADRGLRPGDARRAAPLLGAGMALAFGLFTLRGGDAPWMELRYPDSTGGRLSAWLQVHAREKPLLLLSPDIPVVYPAVNEAEARLQLPFMSTWLLQAVYQQCPAGGARYRDPAAMPAAERFVWDEVVERVVAEPPAAAVIQRWTAIPDCAGQRFDFLEYFRRDPRFAASWARMRPAGEIDGFFLYIRED